MQLLLWFALSVVNHPFGWILVVICLYVSPEPSSDFQISNSISRFNVMRISAQKMENAQDIRAKYP